jgi:poly-gamma-glutamate capsule biosynthesis protein CapA/YwtB (metallophosphatase superfamily)
MSFRVLQAVILTLTLLAAAPAVGQRPTKDQLRLLFTGDILLSRKVEAELKHRNRSPWINLQKLFRDAEWVAGNFEGAIGHPSDCISSKSPCFATQEADLELLQHAGFRALVIENNHAGDLGNAGRRQTLKAFHQAGLLAVDFKNSPQFIQAGKVTLALVAVTTIPAADGQVQHLPSGEVLEKLRMARLRANVLVVSVHWGHELIEWPSDTQRKEAAWLVENGADLVLGHHPHVIQRPECIEGRPVFFSLGNHVFDQANPKTKDGLIADCRVGWGRLRCRGIRTHTEPGTSTPNLAGPDRATSSALASCVPRIDEHHKMD